MGLQFIARVNLKGHVQGSRPVWTYMPLSNAPFHPYPNESWMIIPGPLPLLQQEVAEDDVLDDKWKEAAMKF